MLPISASCMRMPLLLAGLLLSFCAGAASPKPGEIPPQILGKDRQDQVVDLGTQHGKLVIVTFWASWCGPCLKELPLLGRLQEVIGEDALQVYAVNWKEPRIDFLRQTRSRDWPRLSYIHDASGDVAKQYGIAAVPHMFVIGQDGQLVHVHRGYSEESLPKILDQILALLPDEVRNRAPASGD